MSLSRIFSVLALIAASGAELAQLGNLVNPTFGHVVSLACVIILATNERIQGGASKQGPQ